jgi:hypothetical protein
VPFCGAILAGAAVVVTVPHIKFYLELLGDSSYVTSYLRALGYRLPDLEQTGSNFGADLQHETPFLVGIGRGTMIADGATLIDADYTSTSFRLTPLTIGPPRLPRKRGRLPRRGASRRQLHDRHQGHGAHGRAGPEQHRPARLALLRDPPLGHHG